MPFEWVTADVYGVQHVSVKLMRYLLPLPICVNKHVNYSQHVERTQPYRNEKKGCAVRDTQRAGLFYCVFVTLHQFFYEASRNNLVVVMDINTCRELRADEIGSTRKTTCLLVVRSWFPICVGCDINILSSGLYKCWLSFRRSICEEFCGFVWGVFKIWLNGNQKSDTVPTTEVILGGVVLNILQTNLNIKTFLMSTLKKNIASFRDHLASRIYYPNSIILSTPINRCILLFVR